MYLNSRLCYYAYITPKFSLSPAEVLLTTNSYLRLIRGGGYYAPFGWGGSETAVTPYFRYIIEKKRLLQLSVTDYFCQHCDKLES